MELPRDETSFRNFCFKFLQPISNAAPLFLNLTYDASTQTENGLPVIRSRPSTGCCTCRKTKCLKLYCECFANGNFCLGCGCIKCYNQPKRSKFRTKAVRSLLERNPDAFENEERGCSCRKSKCSQKYCECFQKSRKCSDKCRCFGCGNKAYS